MSLPRWTLAGLVAVAVLSPLPSPAQPGPDGGTPSSPPPQAEAAAGEPDAGVSAEDLAAIEAAMGGAQQPPPAEPAPAPSGGASLASPVSFHGLDLSLVLDVAGAWFTADEPLQTGGHDPTERGFNWQQLELTVGSVVDPYFRFDANIVFAQGGVEIEEAYVTSLALPANLQLRGGQFLTRFGRQNGMHPHAWAFVDQPFALGRVFGGEGNRGLGVELSWLTPLPWFAEVSGSVTDATGEGTARSFLGAGGPVESPLDFQFTGALKQFFPLSDATSVLWGLSAATGPNATGYRNQTDVYGTDLYLRYRPVTAGDPTVVTWQSEVLYRRRQVPGDLLTDLNLYSQLGWQFAKRWGVAARYELGTPARGSDGDVADDPLDPDWTARRERVSANVTFWPSEFSRLRLQGATDRGGWRDGRDYSGFLAFEAVVGAHRAHRF